MCVICFENKVLTEVYPPQSTQRSKIDAFKLIKKSLIPLMNQVPFVCDIDVILRFSWSIWELNPKVKMTWNCLILLKVSDAISAKSQSAMPCET